MFGFACAGKDEEARNYAKIDLGDADETSVESVVGVDLGRYIPGLYWSNYFSAGLLAERRIDVAKLGALEVRTNSVGSIVIMYRASAEWKKHFSRISNILAGHKSFFSRAKLDAAIRKGVRTLSHADRWLDR